MVSEADPEDDYILVIEPDGSLVCGPRDSFDFSDQPRETHDWKKEGF